jgi:hypothetical protein
MAGTVIVDTINSSVAGTPPVFQANGTEIGTLCRAWVNFNGTGTVAIRASFNVSSITDNGTGDYTVNFTNAMPDTNYAVIGTSSDNNGGTTPNVFWAKDPQTARTTTLVRVATYNLATGLNDSTVNSLAVFR